MQFAFYIDPSSPEITTLDTFHEFCETMSRRLLSVAAYMHVTLSDVTLVLMTVSHGKKALPGGLVWAWSDEGISRNGSSVLLRSHCQHFSLMQLDL